MFSRSDTRRTPAWDRQTDGRDGRTDTRP